MAITARAYERISQEKEVSWIRVRTKINSQILRVEAPGWQGVKEQEYQAYSELSQRRQAGCIGA